MDIVDHAQERELAWTHHAIRNQLQRIPIGDGDRLVVRRVIAHDCADCREPIPLARLSAVPSTECCTFCQDQRERAQ